MHNIFILNDFVFECVTNIISVRILSYVAKDDDGTSKAKRKGEYDHQVTTSVCVNIICLHYIKLLCRQVYRYIHYDIMSWVIFDIMKRTMLKYAILMNDNGNTQLNGVE